MCYKDTLKILPQVFIIAFLQLFNVGIKDIFQHTSMRIFW